MDKIFKYLAELWQQLGHADLAEFLFWLAVPGIPAIGLLGKLSSKLWKGHQQRKLAYDLHPFYTVGEIQQATQFYVNSKFQNVAPSKDEEPGRTHAVAAKGDIMKFFLQKAFKQDDTQFYIVLADSGMGKTTFLINLYLRYVSQFFPKKYQIKLFPLGYPNIDEEIEKIPDEIKRQTILLLDAFDEDIQALENYKARMQVLVQKVLKFREVVITCRTQFFPSEEEEPKETGVMRFGPKAGQRVFYKLYLSPFDIPEIENYLHKRFGWWRWTMKRKARRIVEYSPSLMMRPMLLSHIKDLLQREQPYTATYQIYAELISRWVEREAHKMPANRREHYQEELFHFSREIAIDMYIQREKRLGALSIPYEDMQVFAEKHNIKLNLMEMKSRSLLNRNARGEYKFSHKSILEYFWAEEAFFNPNFRPEILSQRTDNATSIDQAQVFLDEMIWEKLTIPFFSNAQIEGVYKLKDGKRRPLKKLNPKQIPQIIYLEIPQWFRFAPLSFPDLWTDKLSCDMYYEPLLFKGLKELQKIILCIPEREFLELQRILPDCQIGRIISEEEMRKICSEPLGVITLEGNGQNSSKHTCLGPCQYIKNDYEVQGPVVIDHATGLMWQQAGTKEPIKDANVSKHIQQLNFRRFAGYDDWRLPTILELITLLEQEKYPNDLYINPAFDKTQQGCCSADFQIYDNQGLLRDSMWVVYFNDFVGVTTIKFKDMIYIRAVRTWQNNAVSQSENSDDNLFWGWGPKDRAAANFSIS